MTDEMTLTVFDPIEALITSTQAENASMDFDHTTPGGEAALRSWVRTVRGYRSGLEKIRVAAKAEALEYGKAVDRKAKELKAPFDEIIDARMKPLDDIEDAKRATAEAIVEAERVAAEHAEADRLADLERREKETAAKEAELNAKQRAADQAEREKRIAAEAAEKATEKADAKAKLAAEQAEHDRLEEIEDTKAVARMDAEVECKRAADKEHQAKCQSEAMAVIRRIVGPSGGEMSIRLLAAIIDGDIPNVTINY